MATKRTYALIAAHDIYDPELAMWPGSEVYVEDRGPRTNGPLPRYEAGIATQLGPFRSKRSCEYGDTWDALIGALRARPARLRRFAAKAWAEAAFDALADGADPTTVALAARQLAAWIRDGALP
jgi:hypothetical protein